MFPLFHNLTVVHNRTFMATADASASAAAESLRIEKAIKIVKQTMEGYEKDIHSLSIELEDAMKAGTTDVVQGPHQAETEAIQVKIVDKQQRLEAERSKLEELHKELAALQQ